MDIKALQLESRFSLPPNSLGYCGRNTAAAKFKRCMISGDCAGVEDEVKKFIVFYPYLKTIATITNLPIFSHEVIEAYWIGNRLLKKAKPSHYDLLLQNFKDQGVPDFFIEELRQKQPKVFIPNHLFQVLHVGVGKASGAVPFNLHSINQCMIRWGKVEKIMDSKIVLNLHSLKEKQSPERSRFTTPFRWPNGLLKGELYKIVKTMPFNLKLVAGLKEGDTVAVHWNIVIKILTETEEKNLLFWTKEVLRSLN